LWRFKSVADEQLKEWNPPFWRMDTPYGMQNRNELEILLRDHVRGAKRVLEIGSCFGHTLAAIAGVMEHGGLIRSIDLGKLPEEAGPYAGFDVEPSLTKMCQKIRAEGFDIMLAIGDSTDQKVIEWARQWAPYDFIMIDGAHDYEGVKKDWINYHAMGKLVAFHDVANPGLGVERFWNELTENRPNRRIVSPMGIGVVSGGTDQ
jgi:predicted O-methyltransferase YrrM